jgi:secreted PhoX family phosphatase
VTNAITAAANGGNFVQRSVIPRVSHEGLAFDDAKAMYYVDELNGGTIYKYVPSNANATDGNTYFGAGQSFALRVGAGGQNEGNNGAAITGASQWVPITNAAGGAIAGTSMVLGDGTIDGRATADVASVASTGYNRPEDLEIQNVAGGGQRLYWTTTDSDINGNTADGTSRVYNLDTATGEVKLFVDPSVTIDLATGLPVGGGLKNADNLAIDANGNLFIVEDRNGGDDDDLWFTKDLNKDGDLLDPGEGIARWASNGTVGSEFTGLYFDKFDANKAYVNIQHPGSGVDRTIMISVPEPTIAMTIVGLCALALRRRRA